MKSDAEFVAKLETSIAACTRQVADMEAIGCRNSAQEFLLRQARAELKANEATLKSMTRSL